MAAVKLDTVRTGVKLLSGLLKAADNEGNANKTMTKRELNAFIRNYGDGDTMDAALNNLYKYAQAKYDVTTPTLSQLNKALSDAMKASSTADKNKDKQLDTAETKKMAATWQSVVDFAKDYQGMSVRDIVQPQNPP